MAPRRLLIVALAATAACKPRRDHADDEAMPVAAPRDAGRADTVGPRDASGTSDASDPAWPELAPFPRAEPVRTIALPARPDVPRFTVGGPAIVGEVAVVSSSQFGFLAVDWRRGAVMWTRPAGLHVAPPIADGDDAVLIGDCLTPPEVRDVLLGCVRVVTATGTDRSYTAIHGARLEAFAAEPGTQEVWPDGDHRVRWRRGERAVTIDLATGVARPAAILPPPLRVRHGARSWDIERTERAIVARERGKLSWQTQRPYAALLGAVYLADLSPMIRVLRAGAYEGKPELGLVDIDATGSLHGQVGFPVPGIATLGTAIDAVGHTALAIRMDTSLRRDYVAGFAASGLLLYVTPLPDVPRADPVGVAIADDAVLAFHDGDAFTVLPKLSPPPTAPGAARPLSQNPTP